MIYGSLANMHKTALWTALILLAVTARARAQQTSGTYTMFVAGNAISTETYTLVSGPGGTVRAEAEITISGSKRKTTTTISKNRRVSFLAQSGETKLLSAAFDGPGVKL